MGAERLGLGRKFQMHGMAPRIARTVGARRPEARGHPKSGHQAQTPKLRSPRLSPG
jgi:hypothetical protein